MKTNPITLNDLISLGLYGATWQQFVDKYNDKYNVSSVDGFKFAPISMGYTFAQFIKKKAVNVLPTYVDPESEGYEMPLGSAEGKVGNIPTQKLFYSVNRTTTREALQLAQRFGQAALDDAMRETMFDLLDEGTDGLIQAFWNALNHQRMQIASTGKFTINYANNPRGIKGVEIDFGIPTANFDSLDGTAKWWTDSGHTTEGGSADPIKYMKDRVKYIRRTAHYNGSLKLELTKDLWDDLLGHSSVLKTIGYKLVPTASSATVAQNVGRNTDDEQKKEVIRKLIEVDQIATQETYAFVSKPGVDENGEPDLVEERIDNFKKENISFLPVGQLGTIQGVSPLSMGYKPEDVAYSMGNRLLIERELVPRTHSLNVNGEMGQLCVPEAVRQMFISTVTV